MIKAIFFDSGDVVVNEGFGPGIIEFEKKFRLPPGTFYDSAHNRKYWKDFTLGNITEDEYFKAVVDDYKIQKIDGNIFREIILNNFSSNEELLNFLKTIVGNYILGIISNHPSDIFKLLRKMYQWDTIFKIYAVSGDLHIRKPAKEIFEYAVRKADVLPEECIYVDNRPDRVDGADLIGMHVIIYKNLLQFKIDLDNILKLYDK